MPGLKHFFFVSSASSAWFVAWQTNTIVECMLVMALVVVAEEDAAAAWDRYYIGLGES
jgi:hypothetical protein